MQENRKNTGAALIPYAAATIVCMCVTYPVFTKGITLDEAYSVNLVRGSIGDIISGTASDVHPPLYYLILKLVAFLGGESFIKYELVTVLACWLNVFWLGAFLIRKRWGNWTSVIYIMWFGMTYATIEYSVLIRMYSWSALFVTGAALFLYFYYERERKGYLAWGICMTLAAMYSHYYALMAVFFSWCILLTAVIIWKRSKIKSVITGGFLVTAGYIPWIKVLLSQSGRVAEGYWIKEFGLKQWFLAPANLMRSELEGAELALYFFVFVLLAVACLKKQVPALLAFSIFVWTMVAGWGISVLVTPIWQDRYLYVAWGMLSLFVALAVGQKKRGYSVLPKMLLVACLGIALVFSVRKSLTDELLACGDKEWVRFIEENIGEDDIVIADDPYEHIAVFQYYMPDSAIVMVESILGEGYSGDLSAIELSLEGSGRAWYVIDHVQPKLGTEKMEELLEKNGYRMEFMTEYSIVYKRLGIYAIERIPDENTH